MSLLSSLANLRLPDTPDERKARNFTDCAGFSATSARPADATGGDPAYQYHSPRHYDSTPGRWLTNDSHTDAR